MTAFDFRAFLDVAEELSAVDDEAHRRSALSRAYYAVFGDAWHALPPMMRTTIGQGQVHRETWRRYAVSTSRSSRQIGSIGVGLRRLRHEADYRAGMTFAAHRVRRALDQARQALALLDRHGYQP